LATRAPTTRLSPAARSPRRVGNAGVRALLTVGIDLVEVAQVAHSVETFGDRYLQRIFTAGELAYCNETRDPARHLAARFAAKEATLKALRQGDERDERGETVDWRCVEVRRRPDGSCDMMLYGAVRALAERRGVDALSVSLSHDGGYATAVVVGERRERGCGPGRLTRRAPRGAYER
jgi:holo-[acyl-carrier protein] synthase